MTRILLQSMIVCHVSQWQDLLDEQSFTYSESMGNDEYCDPFKLLMDHSGDLSIGSRVNTGSSFIHNQQLVLVKESSSHDNKLLLAGRKTERLEWQVAN